MKIHEYQARDIFSSAGIPALPWGVASTPDEAEEIARSMNGPVVIKAQVHVGGRGKAGGVKLAANPAEARTAATAILGMNIKGLIVRKVLVARSVNIVSEAYLGITVDRAAHKVVLIGTASGGVEIEQIARETPDAITKICVNPARTPDPALFQEMALKIYSDRQLAAQAADILSRMYDLFIQKDCSLAEINPLAVNGDTGNLVAADSKIVFDDNALFRHPELAALQDLEQENPKEMDAREHGLSFVDLDGDIGCIVNGAGLAMATMDMIKAAGSQPANFLDVGGSSNPDKVLHALRIILSNPRVKAIVINIFGGITRCDDIAAGILRATQNMNIPVPVFVRLTGTNREKAMEMLKDSKLSVADSMDEVIRMAVDSIRAKGERS